MSMKSLDDLFEHVLRDIYYAEKKVLKALPKMVEKANADNLRNAFESHLNETESHVRKLEDVFKSLGMEAKGVTCEAIDGILEETTEIMDEIEDPEALDAGMIAAAQAVEHYEITRYGTLVAWAKELGKSDVVQPLESILDEEYSADKTLSGIAEERLNKKAA